MPHPQSKKLLGAQQGVSLVELLIAMTLGLILLAGMLAVFSGNQRSAELNTAMANIQENARFALNKIGQDIRMAGYQGCLDPRRGRLDVRSVQAPIPMDGIRPDGTINFNINLSAATGSVVQSDGTWFPPIPGGFQPPIVNAAIPGTHVLSVQLGATNDTPLDESVNSGGQPDLAGTVKTVKNLGFKEGDLALIGNCTSVDLFTVTDAPFHKLGQELSHAAGGSDNINGNFSSRYGTDQNLHRTRVMRFLSKVYYIGDTGLVNDLGDQIRALYLQTYPYNDPTNPPTEIVQGVENMRISFGQKDRDTLRYVTADHPLFNPIEVESVQLGLIMTSWDHIAEQDDQNTYVIAGQAIAPSKNSQNAFTHAEDGRYRLVFNTTVKIRNRRDEQIEFN